MKFSELGLEESLLKSIDRLGYAECTPIQTAVIPEILKGRDVSGLAQTGTGKTGAFLIPLMDRILKARNNQGAVETAATEGSPESDVGQRYFKEFNRNNFVLVLVPTRELAEQVASNIEALGKDSELRGVAVYGGTGYDKQKDAFKNGVEFCVATPGRLIDLYKDHVIDLKQVRAIVFDEADRMFDMGFKDDMKFILQRVPRERQFLVFSATLNFDVMNTAYQFGAEPVEVNVSRDQAKAENVKDSIFHVGHNDKPQLLLSLLQKHKPQQAMVFSNFKMNVERIAHFLTQNGHAAMGISSLLTQAQRNRVIEMFRDSKTPSVMVATDVAARGLDIKGVDLVVNFELPDDAESYVHRIGRTGRAGSEGVAFSLVCDRDIEALGRIEAYLKHKVEAGWVDDSELIKDFKPFPRESDLVRFGGSTDRTSSRGPARGPGRGQGRGERGGDRHGDRSERGRRPRGDRPEVPMEAGSRPVPRSERSERAPEMKPREAQDRRPRRGRHHEGEGPQAGPRPPRPMDARSGDSSRRHDHRRSEGRRGDQRPKQSESQSRGKSGPIGQPSRKPAPAAPTIVAKVSSFFKKIFTGSSQAK